MYIAIEKDRINPGLHPLNEKQKESHINEFRKKKKREENMQQMNNPLSNRPLLRPSFKTRNPR